jgi:predicted DNA-binding transcriptional regulator AlpA
MQSESTWLTAPAAARYIGVAVGTLANWRTRGEGPPYVKLGKASVRYDRGDIDGYLKARRVGTRSEGDSNRSKASAH